MKYKRFEELPVWRDALALAASVYALTEGAAFRRRYSLRDQIERAAVSVSNNIAEGFERGTNQELLAFLFISRGSAGEVRSMLCLLETIAGFADSRFQIQDLKSKAESVSKQLGAWVTSLKNSEMMGQRHVTEKIKSADEAKRGREDFLKKLEQVRKGAPYEP